MKTNYLKAGLMALAFVGALFPSRSEAAASIEEVGFYYAEYLRSTIESQFEFNYPDTSAILNALAPTYGNNVAYYFYYDKLIGDIERSIVKIGAPQHTYYRYLAALYSYYYSAYPGYSEYYESYFGGYADTIEYNYDVYEGQQTANYYSAQEYLSRLIFQY